MTFTSSREEKRSASGEREDEDSDAKEEKTELVKGKKKQKKKILHYIKLFLQKNITVKISKKKVLKIIIRSFLTCKSHYMISYNSGRN